jgi:hypothetical protein
VEERIRVENRIAALLATQGIRKKPSLRSWGADVNALRTGDGRPLPTHLVAELNRLRRRLSLTLEMIRELDAERQIALEEQQDPASQTVKMLCTTRVSPGRRKSSRTSSSVRPLRRVPLRLFGPDHVAAGRLQRAPLQAEVLIDRRNAGIAAGRLGEVRLKRFWTVPRYRVRTLPATLLRREIRLIVPPL